ncbi:MAG TPA: hypothetical protein IAB45_00685 [Candidatus Onthousia faecavium]|nr:hypothetical protein [Candidatus Onthousia faecavium]
MQNNRWIKVVVTIIILELVVGGIIFAYKKLNTNTSNNSLSLDDAIVTKLYNEIAYFDLDSIDVMDPKVMLYYAYNNVDPKDTINCESVSVESDTTGYSCNGTASFVSKESIEDVLKEIYGPTASITEISFPLSPNEYAYYDTINDGFVVYTKDEQESVDPINLKLKEAFKDKETITLTVEVLDGILGTINDTYKYTFEQDGDNYYLIRKELVTS